MECENNLQTHNRIDVDDYVHIVDGKVICFDTSVLDLSLDKDLQLLYCFADELYTVPDLPRRFGKDTVCILVADSDADGGRFTSVIVHISDLPESVQSAVKRYSQYE